MSFGGPSRSQQQLPYRSLAAVVPSRNGWLCVPARLSGVSLAPMQPVVYEHFLDIMDWKPAFEVIAVHIPIGLLDKPVKGGRRADIAARELLGRPRALSIMTPPIRSVLPIATREEAAIVNGGMSITAWQLMSRIREIAAEVASYNQRVVYEVHPELSFYEMNDCVPMQYSKHKMQGRAERETLLRSKIQNIETVLDAKVKGPTRAKVLDASACLWSARRIMARGAAIRVPDDPEWDSEGLRMDIWR
jgi:predicted RNase H-like nuclease